MDKQKFYFNIQNLYEKNIILRGKKFVCKECRSLLWFPLDSLEDEVKCYCCGNMVNIPIFSGTTVINDSFKLNELISSAIDQGILSQLLTVNFLYNQKIIGIRFIFDCEIIEKKEQIAEIDIIFTLGHKVGLAEVKTKEGFPKDQIDKYVKVSRIIGADMLLFSTLCEKDSQEVMDLISYLNSLDLSIPALILTKEMLFRKDVFDITPYFQRDKFNECFKKGPILIGC